MVVVYAHGVLHNMMTATDGGRCLAPHISRKGEKFQIPE